MSNRDLAHPSSLKIFFATEMWERYGFYVVQSLLALYLALHFRWNDAAVYALVGSFTALTYLSPVLGGWIADNLIGQKMSIFFGACILLLSYVLLASATSRELLVAALAGVAVGTGLFKPNISSLLGNAYSEDSPKRESGFTIFYMGITAGIVLGTTLPSQLNAMFGWPVSFLSAAFGMLVAITVFDYGIRRYRISDYHPRTLTLQNTVKTLLLLILLWGFAFAILNHPSLADSAFAAIVLISLVYMAVTIRRENGAQARQTFVIGLLCVISVMFWAFYFQMFLSLTLCIARIVKPTLFGLQFPPPYYVAVQSLGMIAAGIFLARRINAPTLIERGIVAANKFVYAMLCITLAYGLIALACHVEASVLMLSPLLLIPSYLLISVAEMLLSPVGLSAITFLASRKRVSTMMGIFFVSLGLGGFLAGKLALLSAIPEGETGILALKEHYAHSFFVLFLILLGASGISIWINRIIQRLLRGTHCE